MKVFISWSGPLSQKLGQSIRDWLPNVIQSVDPYFTPSDVDKGTRWLSEITRELNNSMVGMLCVTRENINNEWLLFEAGALSTKLDKTHVCPILFGIKPTDLSGPLKQFQATQFNGGDFRKLINTINSCIGEQKLSQKTLDAVFEKWWPDLENEIKGILDAIPPSDEPIRSDREILEELLQLTRRGILHDPESRRSISPRAVRDFLIAYIQLHDQQTHHGGGYQEALDALKEMHKPLLHIAGKYAPRSDTIRGLFDRFKKNFPTKCYPKKSGKMTKFPLMTRYRSDTTRIGSRQLA